MIRLLSYLDYQCEETWSTIEFEVIAAARDRDGILYTFCSSAMDTLFDVLSVAGTSLTP